jgi:malonate-semialdehyde dehydrogenase (acetylating) / methylmalonate-semialdehyde dehydrogenase
MTANGTSYPPKILNNFINGTFSTVSSSRTLAITNPYDGTILTTVSLSTAQELDIAVQAAQKAFAVWSKTNVKTRVLKLMKLHQLMTENLDELAEMVVKEHGKNIVEAKASITKGMETLEVYNGKGLTIVGYWVTFVSSV